MRYFYSTLARILRLFSGYPLTITNAVAGDLNEYTVSGNSKQEGTPTPSAPIEVTSVGDRTINLFDMKYDVGYTGSYPNITTVSGGKSTEWIETSKFGQYFYFIWNVKELLANCVLGLVYSNDKSEILYRDGLVNSSIVPAVNTDYVGGGGNPYKINSTYTYVKFYFLNWANVNRIGIYTTLQNTFIPYGYKIPVINGANCGVVDLGTLTWTYRSDLAAGEFSSNGRWWVEEKIAGKTNIYINGYKTVDKSATQIDDMEICGHETAQLIYIRDIRYTDATAFKQAMSGKYLYYQRTTDASWTIPTTTNIYLSEPIRKVGTYADSVFYGEGKNLFDNTTNNKWIAVSGEITEATGCCARKFICNAGDVFVLKAKYSTTTANNIICVCAYDANGNKLTRTVKTDFVEDSIRFICPSSTAYIYAGRSTAVPSDIMLIKGYTVPTEYQPFSDTSKITRNVGVKVLDGTESWQSYTYQGSSVSFYLIFSDMIDTTASTSGNNFYNTHLTFAQGLWGSSDIGFACSTMKRMFMRRNTTDTLETWTAWIAAQYAAGTPVIVLYPLETPTTEVNATPAITVAKGMNILTTGTELVPSNMTAKAWTE